MSLSRWCERRGEGGLTDYAKVLVTGSVIDADQSVYLVARIIGTETSRVLGESVKGKASDAIGDLVEQLAEKVGATISTRASGWWPRSEAGRADCRD